MGIVLSTEQLHLLEKVFASESFLADTPALQVLARTALRELKRHRNLAFITAALHDHLMLEALREE